MASVLRDGDVSPVELVRCALAAIEAEARRGEFRGPVHGVPIGIKDIFLVKGTRTRRGSHVLADPDAVETGTAAKRLLAAGAAVMVGRNTTPETGWKASSGSPLTGVTRNPWDPARTPGGSSASSAAAPCGYRPPSAVPSPSSRPGASCLRGPWADEIGGYSPAYPAAIPGASVP